MNTPKPFQFKNHWYVSVDGRNRRIKLEEYVNELGERVLVYPAMYKKEDMLEPPILPVFDEDGEVLDPDKTWIWLSDKDSNNWRLETHHYETYVDSLCYPPHYKKYIVRVQVYNPKYVWAESQEMASELLESKGYKIISCCLV